mmetsp:Transcript_32738/g.83046  ORF Transcript_32738/g.83046 Transcript_32738/m.83046 type:complete len:227 (-) Transcript_32738:130-810(-)
MTSSLLALTASSTFLQYASVSFCTASSSPFLASLENASPTLSTFFITSLRTLRTATLASSPNLAQLLASSLRRSCVSCGRPRRIFSPSLLGLMPRSDSLMARSMSLSIDLSKGEMSRVEASGTLMDATFFSGTCAPYCSTMTRSRMAGLARPVRMVLKFSLRAASDFFMRSSASALTSFSILATSTLPPSSPPLPPFPPLPLGASSTAAPPLPPLPLAKVTTAARC